MRRWWALKRWRWDRRLFWFLMVPPHEEFVTFFMEGKKGEGKTRYLAGYGVRMMRKGFRVCSNFSIRDRRDGHRSVPVGGWLDVLRFSVDALRTKVPTVFVIDEFHLWCDSRSWQKTPAWFRGWLAQSRHYGVGLCGSCQNFTTMDVRARQIVDELRRIRRLHLWRVPGYRIEEVAPESVDKEAGYELSSASVGFHRWYAGYDTRELIQVEEWASDEVLDAEVERLTGEAAALVAPGEIEAFADTWGEVEYADNHTRSASD